MKNRKNPDWNLLMNFFLHLFKINNKILNFMLESQKINKETKQKNDEIANASIANKKRR
jgi:hypothetical protein